MKTIKIGNVEITKPVKCKTYDESIKNCPEGFHLPKLSELVQIMENSDYLLNCEKKNWVFFWSDTKTKNSVQRLYRNGDGAWAAVWDDLDNSYVGGRVVYIKDKKDANMKRCENCSCCKAYNHLCSACLYKLTHGDKT